MVDYGLRWVRRMLRRGYSSRWWVRNEGRVARMGPDYRVARGRVRDPGASQRGPAIENMALLRSVTWGRIYDTGIWEVLVLRMRCPVVWVSVRRSTGWRSRRVIYGHVYRLLVRSRALVR